MKKLILSRKHHHILYPGEIYTDDDEKKYDNLTQRSKDSMNELFDHEPKDHLDMCLDNTYRFSWVNGVPTIFVQNDQSFNIGIGTKTEEYVEVFINNIKIKEELPIGGKVMCNFKFSDIPYTRIKIEFKQANKTLYFMVTTEEHHEKWMNY